MVGMGSVLIKNLLQQFSGQPAPVVNPQKGLEILETQNQLRPTTEAEELENELKRLNIQKQVAEENRAARESALNQQAAAIERQAVEQEKQLVQEQQRKELEENLIKHLNYFPEIINQAVNKYIIHNIPQYLLTLCQTFNSFYSVCPVISEDKQLEKARLLLIKCVQIVIKTGLNLLGIDTLDKM